MSRGHGAFTCPVRTGAVLIGAVDAASPAPPAPGPSPEAYVAASSIPPSLWDPHPGDEGMRTHLHAIASQRSCAALNDVTTAGAQPPGGRGTCHVPQRAAAPCVYIHTLLE